MSLQGKYHPGICEATAYGKRYGKNLTPQRYDSPGHCWHLAKDKNWSTWSCCGGKANSPPCQDRPAGYLHSSTSNSGQDVGVGAYIQFLINNRDRVLVVGENTRCWLLSSGRVAKKGTQYVSWVWAKDAEDDKRLSSELRSLLSVQVNGFYSVGTWGYHTAESVGQALPGFSPSPPGAEICGRYKVLYVAALRYDQNRRQASSLLRRVPKSGQLVLSSSSKRFSVGVSDNTGRRTEHVTSQTILYGHVLLQDEGSSIDRYFGPGYRFYGFGADSEAAGRYTHKASNAGLIVTCRNDNKGRIYQVSETKALPLVESEHSPIVPSASTETQSREAREAQRICRCRHYSFLCKNLSLPCSVAARITAFACELPPFIFAEPGDVWIDVRLSTPVRTYVLARRVD